MRVELESLRKENRIKGARILELELSGNNKNQDSGKMNEQIESLERINRTQASKIEELKENKVHLEDKVNKLKTKLEGERGKFESQKQVEIDEKRDKIQRVKAELKEKELLVQKLLEEKRMLEFELGKQSNVNATLERALDLAKSELIDLQQKQYNLHYYYKTFNSLFHSIESL